MKTVKQLLREKGHGVASIGPDESIIDAMQLMAADNIGALLVLKNSKLIGIVTERDFSRKSYLLNKPMKDILVKDIMTQQVAYVSPDYTNEDCMALITEMRIRHLPVLDDEQLIGIISIGDLVKDTISQHEFIIHQLERYIYDTPE
ncbi:CBS domain-containing protein [Nitrosomonas cryotolerans]|uniref:CBS domain-containing protein n=1 Tax=Nitrosomonas cryotolerans ATCC 49181 TaxID=1131553 RepID=A0A1N6JJL5_9PROT|nr:CBS domain-containing protein [Nitrosomonas cryotolerans]SFQ03898.1 CBS domain-containing protein [Nitrosomonas cryotolerans]SIO44367.1 CBS domain-containing protein [Nitrosomonas cryotolerans ATCC 49181]